MPCQSIPSSLNPPRRCQQETETERGQGPEQGASTLYVLRREGNAAGGMGAHPLIAPKGHGERGELSQGWLSVSQGRYMSKSQGHLLTQNVPNVSGAGRGGERATEDCPVASPVQCFPLFQRPPDIVPKCLGERITVGRRGAPDTLTRGRGNTSSFARLQANRIFQEVPQIALPDEAPTASKSPRWRRGCASGIMACSSRCSHARM